MKQIFLYILFIIVFEYSIASDCSLYKKLSCDKAEVYTLVNTIALVKDGETKSLYDEGLKVKGFTDGKFHAKVKSKASSEEKDIETIGKIINSKPFNAIFELAKCRGGRRILKDVKGQPLQILVDVKNFNAIWPAHIKCDGKPEKFFSSTKEIKSISLNELKKHSFFELKSKEKSKVYFGYPNKVIEVNVEKNLCKDKICDAKKKMEVVSVKNLDSVMFDDDNELYFSSPEI